LIYFVCISWSLFSPFRKSNRFQFLKLEIKSTCPVWNNTDFVPEIPNHSNESIRLVNKTKRSVFIEWEHIYGIPKDLEEFYGYQIEYKEDTKGSNFTFSGVLSYKSDPQWSIEDLKVKTSYSIKVTPFRKYENMKELAKPYDTLRVQTESIGELNGSMCEWTNAWEWVCWWLEWIVLRHVSLLSLEM